MHQADRVRLQFGFPQFRPAVAPRDMRDFHAISMHTVTKALLSSKFEYQIATWNQRRQLVIPGNAWNFEVKPDRNYIHWLWGYFGLNLFVSRPSVLGDPRQRVAAPPVGLDYPPSPQPDTPPQQPNYPPTPQFNPPQPYYHNDNPQPDTMYLTQPPYYTNDNTQSDHAYHTPQPNYDYTHTQQSNYPNPNMYNTYNYQPPTHPLFQNSAVTYGDYSSSSQQSSSHHMYSNQGEESSHTYAESSQHSHQNFELPPAYLQTYSEPPSQPSRYPQTQASQNFAEMVDDLMATPAEGTINSPIPNETMNNFWAGTLPEQAQVQEDLGRGLRKKFPRQCHTTRHRRRDE